MEYPAKIDTASVQQQLEEFGYHVSRRTVQRDLKNLAENKIFPLVYDDTTNPFGWSWARDGARLDTPLMDPNLALTLVAERYLQLPPTTRTAMGRCFKLARKILDALPDCNLRRWPDIYPINESPKDG